jgi:hypothetical protein
MHPLTRFFNHLKRIGFSLALAREHIEDLKLTEWYPEWIYELMESDEVRTEAYRDVIREAVSDKVVLELGTGRKALLATFCSASGARKVYAIEANKDACEASRAHVQSLGLRNISVICGFSDQVKIPERCDVLVHDLIGDIASSEGMIPFVADARRRFLTPGAIQIPRRCATHAVLAEDPKLSLAEWALSCALRGFKRFDDLRFVRFFGFPHAAALSEPRVFEDFLLSEASPERTNKQIVFEVTRDGLLRGVLFYIRISVGETRTVDTWNSQTSWSTPYVRLEAEVPVTKGDLVEMRIESDLLGNPSYSLKLAHVANGSTREIGRYAWSGD